jgi:glucose 1-dehydrogenase
MRFPGKVCIVTGAASGIGRAVAQLFAREGANVCLIDVDPSGEEVAGEISASSSVRAIFLKADVSSEAESKASVDAAVHTFGRIDFLVNNAGTMGPFVPLVEMSADDWDRVLAVNLRGAFLYSKHSIPHMPPGSSIVNLSSVHAHRSSRLVVPYAASKGALEALTRGLSVELEERGIRVNCVAPGAIDTPMLWDNPNVSSGNEVVKKVGEPEQVAEAIAFLVSPGGRFISGATLVVDGGRLAQLG